MLSAWLRMKYPHVFASALAASAPILFFDGYVNADAYDDIATDDYRKADADCPEVGHHRLRGQYRDSASRLRQVRQENPSAVD